MLGLDDLNPQGLFPWSRSLSESDDFHNCFASNKVSFILSFDRLTFYVLSEIDVLTHKNSCVSPVLQRVFSRQLIG